MEKIVKRLKDQRGLTLIELLAVVVILGIIAAIAVPSVGNIIDNTKKDAHVANAQQMINSAKIATAADIGLLPSSGSIYLSMNYLHANGYLDTVKDPDGDGYATGAAEAATADPGKVSYVKITKESDGKYSYDSQVYGSARHIAIGDEIKRDDVENN
jgi:type IV pilus assembly protein PilA